MVKVAQSLRELCAMVDVEDRRALHYWWRKHYVEKGREGEKERLGQRWSFDEVVWDERMRKRCV